MNGVVKYMKDKVSNYFMMNKLHGWATQVSSIEQVLGTLRDGD